MNAITPLLGIVVLCLALTVNFFHAAWKLGVLRSFGRRQALSWKTIWASVLAACLPLLGTLIALTIAGNGVVNSGDDSALQLSLLLSGIGLAVHLVNDQIVRWVLD